MKSTLLLLLSFVILFGCKKKDGEPEPITTPPPSVSGHWDYTFTQTNGLNGAVTDMAIYGNDVYVIGFFDTAGTIPISNNIAKWDGVSWSAVNIPNVTSISHMNPSSGSFGGMIVKDNILYIPNCNGVGDSIIAKYDGSNWTFITWTFITAQRKITHLVKTDDGLFACFNGSVVIGDDATVGIWNGSTWSTIGTSGYYLRGNTLAVNGNTIYMGFDSEEEWIMGPIYKHIAKYDGSSIDSLGIGLSSGYQHIYEIDFDSHGNLYVCGTFTKAGGITVNHIAKWNGSVWTAMGNGVNNAVNDLVIDNNDNVYICGFFTTSGSTVLNGVAKWDGANWISFGSGLSSPLDNGFCMAVANNGDVYVGGSFLEADGHPSYYIARWIND